MLEDEPSLAALAVLAVTVIAHCCALVFPGMFFTLKSIFFLSPLLIETELIETDETEKVADPGHPPDELKVTSPE